MRKLILFIFLFLTACISQPLKQPTKQPTNTQIPPTLIPSTTTIPSSTTILEPTPTATPIAESTFDGVRVTLVSNAGFLITVGDQRVLIDAIYEGHPQGTLKPLLTSQPPFDGVDLILTTHDHQDHFDADLVLQYLQNNPETLFASTPSAVNAILTLDSSMRPRLTAINPKEGERKQLTLADIDLEAFFLPHLELSNVPNALPGPPIPYSFNLGFIVTIDNVKLFHPGDLDPIEVSLSDLQGYVLSGKKIDIVFVHRILFSANRFYSHITEGLQARYLIPMHDFNLLPELETDFPAAIILHQPYESWIMP